MPIGDVDAFLGAAKLGDAGYAAMLRAEGFEMDDLPHITDAHLQEAGISKVLHRARFLRVAKQLRPDGGAAPAGAGAADAAGEASEFRVGDKVRRRDGSGSWGLGFVTSTAPLLVTASRTDASAAGFEWNEVEAVSDKQWSAAIEQEAEEKYHEESKKAAAAHEKATGEKVVWIDGDGKPTADQPDDKKKKKKKGDKRDVWEPEPGTPEADLAEATEGQDADGVVSALEAGADINAGITMAGDTPLMHASLFGYADVVEVLLKCAEILYNFCLSLSRALWCAATTRTRARAPRRAASPRSTARPSRGGRRWCSCSWTTASTRCTATRMVLLRCIARAGGARSGTRRRY